VISTAKFSDACPPVLVERGPVGGPHLPGHLQSGAQVHAVGVMPVGRFVVEFTDEDALVAAVFDWVIADIAATTQAAVAAPPQHELAKAAMANVVRTVVGDARIGRLLFSSHLANAVLARSGWRPVP
jgi:hypothetical protein